MRSVLGVFLSERGGGGEPTGVATDRLEDDELVDLLHIARENARLLDGEGDVARRRTEAGGVIRREEVVVDRLRNAETAQFVTLGFAVLFDAADRIHRVVSAREEVVTDVILLELFENDGEIGFLNLVAAASERAAGRRLQAFDDRGVDRAEIDELVLHEAFDSVLHTVDFVDFRIGVLLAELEATLNDAAEARVNNAGGTAALTDDGVAL